METETPRDRHRKTEEEPETEQDVDLQTSARQSTREVGLCESSIRFVFVHVILIPLTPGRSSLKVPADDLAP
eukprot:368938-Hanusia_phi.AAC.4